MTRVFYNAPPQTWEPSFVRADLTLINAVDIDYNTAVLYTRSGYRFELDYYTTAFDYVITSIEYQSSSGRELATMDQLSITLTEFVNGSISHSSRSLVGTWQGDVFAQNGASGSQVATFNRTGSFEIDGRGGTDTVDYGSLGYSSSMIRSGRVEQSGDTLVITQPDGDVDRIENVERFSFTDGTLTLDQVLDRAGLNEPPIAVPDAFSHTYYSQQAGLSGASRAEAYQHFAGTGWRIGLDPNSSFDTSDYLAAYPDIAAANINPFEHYIFFGEAEGRLPDPGANTGLIRAYGQHMVDAFDSDFYLGKYADVVAAGIDPLVHFMEFGWREGRDPTASFDTTRYLAVYRDVDIAGINPYEHFIVFGQSEGRTSFSSSDFW
ncbi:MAG: lipocalin family protein [Alphaproteobacteria bacterium]|nr:lipocalin family protein [Alphaproteobacteria bacterium]